eukprot:Opistho-2@56107
MQRIQAKPKRRTNRPGRIVDLAKYPQRLQLYKVPPNEEITMETFEDLAIERVKLLRAVEVASIRYPKKNADYEALMREAVKKHMPLSELREGNEEVCHEERRRDHFSHFILRLAYCRTEDLRRWMLKQETDLFRHRLSTENSREIGDFLASSGLKYVPIGTDKKNALHDKLRAAGAFLSDDDVDKEDYFSVPFEEALELVRSRKVYLENGMAYVPRRELAAIVSGAFRAVISEALAATERALPSMEEDDRLLPILQSVTKQGPEYSRKASAGKVTLDQIDPLSRKAFPLCMSMLHDNLRATHHLRHGGRLQYGLFLKAIGLTLEEALQFWQTEFTKVMAVDKFDKQYAYNIRHNYGKEGKRADYTPYSCMRIIMGTAPATGDHHGCPFKHHDQDVLRNLMQTRGVSATGINEVLQLIKEGHFQLACTRYYEAANKMEAGGAGFVVNHPNQYFDEAHKIILGKAGGVKSEPAGAAEEEGMAVAMAIADEDDVLANVPMPMEVDGM